MSMGGKDDLISLPSRDIEYHQPQQRMSLTLTPEVRSTLYVLIFFIKYR
jgi:hypothetical protein